MHMKNQSITLLSLESCPRRGCVAFWRLHDMLEWGSQGKNEGGRWAKESSAQNEVPAIHTSPTEAGSEFSLQAKTTLTWCCAPFSWLWVGSRLQNIYLGEDLDPEKKNTQKSLEWCIHAYIYWSSSRSKCEAPKSNVAPRILNQGNDTVRNAFSKWFWSQHEERMEGS